MASARPSLPFSQRSMSTTAWVMTTLGTELPSLERPPHDSLRDDRPGIWAEQPIFLGRPAVAYKRHCGRGYVGTASRVCLEQLVVVRFGRCLEQASRATSEVGEVDAAGLRLLGEPLREIERLVEDLAVRRRTFAHVEQDRPLGPRRDDRFRHSLDPDTCTAPVAPLAFAEGFERVDLVGARVLAEPENDHATRLRHGGIISEARPHGPRACATPTQLRVGLTARHPRRRRYQRARAASVPIPNRVTRRARRGGPLPPAPGPRARSA